MIRMPFVSVASLALLGVLIAGCGDAPSGMDSGSPTVEDALSSAAATITAAGLEQHIVTLSSDEFGGRGPSSPGGDMTVEYLAEQFADMGLEPGNEGSWYQDVPLVDITADPATASIEVSGGDGPPMDISYADEAVTWTTRVVESVGVEGSDMVFVGYGVVAPEYGWDDYAGVDVEGKTVVMLVNDPGYATQDPELFTGNAMTYYGRWTYKFEEAARQGAAAAIVIHQTEPASYGWETVRNSWTGPQYNLEPEDGNMDRVAVEGWFTEETSRAVFDRAGLDFDGLTTAAASADFEPVEMGLTFSASLDNTLRSSESRNVIALVPGMEAPDEYFVYTAHWDHLGTDPELEAAGDDGIYNGALDNASGTAAMLEIAQAFATRDEPPRRSIVFLAVTAEEQGLLGSKHYAQNPVYPLSQTVAGLNMDGLNSFGPTHDIVVAGYGMSELDGVMEEVAAEAGRRVVPDPTPEAGYYYRSDHFELAKMGVPMIYPDNGTDAVEGGTEVGEAAADRYRAERYHMPTDEYDETWRLDGAVADVRLFYEMGARIADSDEWLNWNEGTEFRAVRDASMGGM
ncbi:MAG TPA: M28 family metallopeptidase [Longimicrobiales bacterium]|nr:M28 family metallopeptidase [Longimicrobiales bacterium]